MSDPTDIDRKSFRRWIRDPVRRLLKQKQAGFALTMISFPILERLLRGKSGIADRPIRSGSDDEKRFYAALTGYFPALYCSAPGTFPDVANVFWQGFRNGILHQATFSHKGFTVKKNQPPASCIFILKTGIAIKVNESKRLIAMDPFAFSESVVELIEADFEIYRKVDCTNHPLAFELDSVVMGI
jgi:hypothetical protein